MVNGIITQCLTVWRRERDSNNPGLVPAALVILIVIVCIVMILFDWLFIALP